MSLNLRTRIERQRAASYYRHHAERLFALAEDYRIAAIGLRLNDPAAAWDSEELCIEARGWGIALLEEGRA